MGVFEQFPYANMHEMNLDWLLKKMKELAQAMETFKATESLKFADPIIWNITTQYEKSTIVLDPTGNAYLSLQAVPAGVQLNNEEYWLEIFNFTDYTRTANQNLTVNTETNTTRATADYQVDDWLIWNDVLYRVTSAIAIDDALIVAPAAGSNIIHFTVEDFIKAFITYATGLINQYKNEIDASELAYQAAMQAEVDRILAGATVDSEVIDARLGADDIQYSTLGNAIRRQISDLMASIDGTGNSYIKYQIDKSVKRPTPTTLDDEVGFMAAVIPCSEGDVFYLKGKGGNTTRLWFFSDENLNTVTNSGQSVTYADMTELIAPPRAAWLSVNSDYTVMNGVCIKATNKKNISINKNSIDEGLIPVSLFNSSDAMRGYELQNNGNVTANADWFVSDYIDVSDTEKIYLSGKSSGGTNFFYDESGNVVKRVTSVITGVIDVPANASTFRCNGELADIDTFTITTYYTFKKVHQIIDYQQPIFKVGYLAFPGGGFSPNSITTVTQSNFIKATKGSKIGVKAGYQFRLALYSEANSDSYIGSVPNSASYTTDTYTFTDDVFFRVSVQTTNEDELVGTEYSSGLIYEMLQDLSSTMEITHSNSFKISSIENKLIHDDVVIRQAIPFNLYESPIADNDRTLFDTVAKRQNISTVYDVFDGYVNGTTFTKELAFTTQDGTDGYAYVIRPKVVEIGVGSGQNGKPNNIYPTIFIMCNQHGGGERGSVFGITYFIKALMEHANENPILDYASKYINFVIVPSSNPWGYNNGSSRNINNVDLDRNWDYNWEYLAPDSGHYSGVSPASELESQGMQALVRKYRNSIMFIDFHTNASASQSYQSNWIAACTTPLSHNFENDLATSHLQRITPPLSERYNISMYNTDFIGYITNHAQSGAPKGYAQLAGIKHSLIFEGLNALPNGTQYSNRVQRYNEEIIGNFIIETIRSYARYNNL